MTSEHQAKIEENRCFRVIFGALGSLGGALGGSWSHLVPRVFSEPKKEHGSLDPLWAPLADPKIARKSFVLLDAGILVQKKCVPKQVHKQDHFFIKVLCNCGDPATLFCELSPTREHDSPKIA